MRKKLDLVLGVVCGHLSVFEQIGHGLFRNVSLLVAIGVNEEGFREVLAVAEGAKEDKASWTAFLRHLKERRLQGVRLFISDKCLGLVESLGSFIRKLCGSGARCIFIGTCGPQCRQAR
jgi:transposase-like protein